jgi:hypothetical protein
MSFVRDTVSSQMIGIIDNTTKAPDSKKLAAKISSISVENKSYIKELVADTIDHCLHYFLYMLEEYEDDTTLIMEDEEGNKFSLAEISDGLCGELYTEDGWIEKYSKYPTLEIYRAPVKARTIRGLIK